MNIILNNMKLLKIVFLAAVFSMTAVFLPITVLADHSVNHSILQLRSGFSSMLGSLSTSRGAVTIDTVVASLLALADDSKIQRLEDELRSYESQIQKLRSKSQTERDKYEIGLFEDEIKYTQSKLEDIRSGKLSSGGLNLTRILQRGSTGNEVTRLQEFLKKSPDVYPEGLATGYFGVLTEKAVTRFQEKNGIDPVGIVGPKTRAQLNKLSSSQPSEFQATVSLSQRPSELLSPLKEVGIKKALKKGDTDEEVSKVQGFLKDFPEIYPGGLATGFYGDRTEKAVKKLQEKVGVAQTGEVDEKTKEILNLLLVAGEKKKPPKITDVTPASGYAGITVTLSGKGFTPENNSIMMRGKIVATGLKSYDNNTQIDFIVTPSVSCTAGSNKACPIKVVNANGISQAKPFKLTEFLLIPPGVATTTSPEPVPPPPPPPAPAPAPAPPPPPPAPTDSAVPVRSNGLPSGELAYGTRSATLSLSTDENATCKYAASVDVTYASMTLQFSTTGGMSHSSSISGLEDGKSYSYYVRCQDSVGNANADDFAIFFSVAAPPKPSITSLSPSKGLVGTSVTVNGSGFTASGNSVSFSGTVAASSLSSADGKTLVFSVPAGTSCKIGETCSVSVSNVNGASNVVGFLRTQSVTPVNVVFPNGGENLVQGVDFTFSWTGGTNRVDIILVEESAVAGSDPGALIVGWIATSTKPDSTVNWNVKTVCSADGAVCTNVTPGKYKIMALSEDEVGLLTIWDDVANLSGNWDLSNNAFTISPSATLTLVVPNGGEIGSKNSAFIVCWATIGLKSKAVKIDLLKNGTAYQTINSSYLQTSETGAFITNWIIPDSIPEGADYQIKVSDVSLPAQNDTSDAPFSIVAATSAIKIYEPYGYPWYSSIWYSGFDGPVSWYGANVPSKTVNINLWKGGFFYRSLASNIPQSYYIGGTAYTTGWFWRKVAIPADLPTDKDYTVEVADAGNPSIRGFSGPFAVVQYPSHMTVKGKLIDYLTKVPLANTSIQNWDGSYYWYKDITNSNGEFSAMATTSDILLSRGHSFWTYPIGHNYGYFSIRSNAYGLYAYISLFPFINNGYSTFPVTAGDVNIGEIPFWPVVDSGYVISDIPTKYNINYRNPETGQSTSNLWIGSGYNYLQWLWKTVPQALDVWARIEDKPGNVYYSPMLNLPVTPPVPSKTLSLFNQTPQWEPYAISASTWYWPQLLKVGTSLSGYTYASGGVAPYTWSILAGSMPPGVTFSSSGSLSGAPTQAGVYDVVFRVQDSNKVNGVTYPNYYPYSLRFDVRTAEGVQVSLIKVLDPQARVEMYPGGTYTISWDSFGITSRSTVLDLYKSGNFLRKIAGFAQAADDGRYYYYWSIPQDLVGGNDYSIRISDVNNSVTYGESDVFLIQEKQNANWGYGAGTTYSPSLSFQYATSTQTFRLYEQRPGQTSLGLVGTFTSPKCYQWITSGKWSLYISCYSWYPNPNWSLQYQTYAQASEFPAGEYMYEFRMVDSVGNETSLTNWKLRALEPTVVTGPTSVDSPLSSSSLTPTIRWTIPKDWPATLEKPYRVNIQETFTGKSIHSMWGLSAPADTAGFRTYNGPSLDPTKKYTTMVEYRRSLIDPATAQRTEYISMSSGVATFWFDQYVPPPAVSISTESLPTAMIWTSYNATLTTTGGIAPYKWSMVSGVLPQGFTLDTSTGRIYGWSSQQGIFKFTVGVGDVLGGTATKDLSIEVKPETGAYWSGGYGTNPLYTQYVRFGYTNGKPADVSTFKLYQKNPGEASFKTVGTFSGITETCNTNFSPIDSLWRLYFACGTTYRYWNAQLKTSYASTFFPLGEYDYYVTAIGSDGVEVSITPTLKQFALDRTKIVSPTEAQSPIASSTLKFEWTVAQTNWPSGVSQPYFAISVYPEGSNSYIYYKGAYGKVGVSIASYGYNGVQLDQTKKYIANIMNYPTTVIDSASLTKSSYISMLDAVTRFWVGP